MLSPTVAFLQIRRLGDTCRFCEGKPQNSSGHKAFSLVNYTSQTRNTPSRTGR